MRYIASAFGSAGDFLPTLAVARALARDGHQVSFVTNPFHERAVRDAGLEMCIRDSSVTARGVLTAINWFVQRTFEEKVFADPRAALLWLRGFNDKLQPDAVLAEISRAVPAFARLRW